MDTALLSFEDFGSSAMQIVLSKFLCIRSLLIVCIFPGVLGAFAPCVLYASNMERLYPGERVFTDHCLHYSCLYFLGSALFNANNLAPCFSAGSRIALRRKYNLEVRILCPLLFFFSSWSCVGDFFLDTSFSNIV